MKTYLDCIPCFMKQALFAARAATNDRKIIKQVLDTVGRHISEIPLDSPPPESARFIYGTVREITGVEDPFRQLKDESIQAALRLYETMAAAVKSSVDPLRTATSIAIAGNVIDFGSHQHFDLEEETGPIFFLLKVKCRMMSQKLGIPNGGLILKEARL